MARVIDKDYLLTHKRKVRFFGIGPDDESWGYAVPVEVIENAPTLTPPNELLTIDDLLNMNQTPIWVMDTIVNRGEWCYWKDGRAYSCENHPEYYDLEDYGKWTAYHQPPRGCRYGRNML